MFWCQRVELRAKIFYHTNVPGFLRQTYFFVWPNMLLFIIKSVYTIICIWQGFGEAEIETATKKKRTGKDSDRFRKIKLHEQLRYFMENGLKSPEFACTGSNFVLFYMHGSNSACICACKTPKSSTG